MPRTERVTVTLPAELLARMDLLERNRSRFIAGAVERELAHRRREELLRSIRNPHPDCAELAGAGLADWGASLPTEDGDLLDMAAGRGVRWEEGAGWVEDIA